MPSVERRLPMSVGIATARSTGLGVAAMASPYMTLWFSRYEVKELW